MEGPSTYSQWTKLLDQFVNGDDSVLEELNKGSFIIDAGTATRFYTKVEEAYKKRKQNWLDKFQHSFQLQNFRTYEEFEIALRNGKQNLFTLHKFINLNGFPIDLKKTLKKDMEDFVDEIKTSLKDNNSKISKGREKILILLKSFELNTIPEEIKHIPDNNEIIAPTGRKIIF